MNKPYIGITGFMNRKEVEKVLEIFPEDCRRRLMVGVLASWKTLNGFPPGNQNRYPPINELQGIFIDDPRVLNLVHYNSRESRLYEQLEKLIEFAGPNLHGFQLNIKWPNPLEILHFKMAHPEKKIVLQVSELENSSESFLNLKHRLKSYIGLVDYVLLDASGGTGKPLDLNLIRRHLISLQAFDFSFVVAGGIGVSALQHESVQQLLQVFPDISIDAESQLRTNDYLDVIKARTYIVLANSISNRRI